MSETLETETQTAAPSMEPESVASVPPVSQAMSDIETDQHGRFENVDSIVSQKHRERIAELEEERDNLAVEVLRHCVAADKGVPASLLAGATEDELHAAADALLEFKGKPSGPVVRADGTAANRAGASSDWLRQELSKK